MDNSSTAQKNKALPPEQSLPTPRLQTPKTIVDSRGLPDLPFFFLTVLLVLIGLIMLFSASYPRACTEPSGNGAYYFIRQLAFAVPGIVIMWAVSRINYEWLRPISGFIMLAGVLLLVAVLFIGTTGGGAQRWIDLGFTTFQPSELVKAAVVIYFAAMIVKFGDRMAEFKTGFLFFGAILAVITVLMLLEPHLSGAIIILGTGAAMMFLGGTRVRYFVITLAVVALLVGIGYVLFPEKMGDLMAEYAMDRVTAWQDPEACADDEGYQIVQSLYAIGSGGLMGLGLGRSRQKYLYLPEEHNDYIFAIVCEELGFVGAVLILLLFALLIVRGYWIALHAKSRYGALLAAGFTTLLAIQVLLNIGVVTNFLPPTGISLPFFSYGGTALLLTLAEMGVILGVSRQKSSKLE